MPSTYSPLLRLELMSAGEYSGVWGARLNTQIGTLLEQAIAGITVVTMASDANHTLTTAAGGSDQARSAILYVQSTPTLTATRSIIIPASSKLYAVRNATTGTQSISVKTASGVAATVPNGFLGMVLCDGTDCYLTSAPVNTSGSSGGTFASLGANTFTGTQTFGFQILHQPALRGSAVVKGALGTGNGTRTLDLNTAGWFTATCNGSTSWVFSNPPASTLATSFVLELTNGGAAAQTWPASVKWPNGTAPVLTGSGTDVLAFSTSDGGATWRGTLAMADSR